MTKANQRLIKELSEIISLLSDEEDCYSAEYVIDRYLCDITYNIEEYKDEKKD